MRLTFSFLLLFPTGEVLHDSMYVCMYVCVIVLFFVMQLPHVHSISVVLLFIVLFVAFFSYFILSISIYYNK